MVSKGICHADVQQEVRATHIFVVYLVQNEPHEVKAGKKGSRQIDVLCGAALDIVAPHGWVGCSQDCGACVESGGDACFGNAHCLLLHHLYNHPTLPHCFCALHC